MSLPHQDPHYEALRARARKAGENMSKSFEDAQKAFKSGKKAQAKQLSDAGRKYQAEMKRLDAEASKWVHEQLNSGEKDGLDLHGLYVNEAVTRAEDEIRGARNRGQQELRLIVGRGSHSTNQMARIKPAVISLLSRKRLDYSTDPRNEGVIIVQL
ncbi:Smr domain-containing protein C11H11,03c OS=Schizosaccharomyces pombe (strain 972 / ATCC 24843) GN=SPAC11H11.03c PE=4 SV=1 [Rhizoctonia solani AG-1 IB]|uniref:Smr domain-containing protein C11H11,03c n=1 Tax=Thanatephorus cucumeris (strain AG1-IB / isolate 7/3/14) TaxID=1108050 RepID=M5BU39_THACB|nr:Smr domain-containing protein C11H11,03c [Rhizoctonia solani AG-1 IB]CEL60491.1 Smr domain-containing protein C11H11,03c OS=Schizosaccharomyces pombe (strain 972 / ATCC 24843) GN=SPAC11H11.03c PE=4 SV=1 [Rhizoctonia solani AG-1 IB]